ncbi:MAG: DHH family phosphoesterase [Candidatus Aminicenantes bacterium]|nr:DHH family phosphoesterase [Candidatus Aminicenantes bacterium]
MLGKKFQSLRGANHALILPHDNPDPDAIAASWGIVHLLKKDLSLVSTIAYGGLIGRAENRAMVKELKIPLVPYKPHLIKNGPAIIMVDCQPHTGNSSLPQDVTPDIVIDHHPMRETTKANHWTYVNEKMGAASTIIAATLIERKIFLTKRLATALFYAIKSETRDLGWEGTREDYDNYISLLPRVDFKSLFRISHPPLSPLYYKSIKAALSRSSVHRYAVVCPMDKVPYPELPAEIADFLILREKIEVSFTLGFYEGDLFLSLRSLKPGLDSADLMQHMVRDYGTGGGHKAMAGGKIPKVAYSKLREIENVLTGRFLQYLSLSRSRAKKLF